MSSALDITYKTPTKFEGSVSASLLGASLHFEGISKNKKLSYLAGYRYKTTSYLLNTLETSGDYNPQFSDFQTLVSYRFSRKVELSFLGNYSSNMYNFVPEKRTTEFGTDKLPYEFNIWYSGQEIDKFETYLGALSLNITPVNNLNLKFIATTFRTKEQETFDIKGEYSINELDNSEGSETYGDSILNIGVGTLLSHARNYLDAYVTAGSHIGTWKTDQHLVKWGMKFQYQYFLDRINEWEVVDSAGYTVPNSDTIILVSNYSRANNLIDYNLFTSFIQDTWELNLHKANIYFNYGVRASLWNFNRALMISPRMTMSIKPAWERDVMLHVSAGVYYQPPFYKEMRTMDNTINYSILPQRSIHVLVGGDYLFTAWERPFKLTAEAYYKWLDDLIPYKIDNLRISYSGENIASGYATGLDLKINGEFVPGAESWFTASIMQTMEDIAGDSISIREDDVLYRVPAGYYPRPTNQTFTAGFYFQDYLPWNPDYKVSVSAFFGTGLPLSQPIDDIYYTKFKMGAYRRVDIGFFKVIKKEGQILGENNPFRHFGSIWVSAEIFNLLGLDNQASVSWIRTVSNQSGLQGMFGVPNYLTGRRLNIKLAAKF